MVSHFLKRSLLLPILTMNTDCLSSPSYIGPEDCSYRLPLLLLHFVIIMRRRRNSRWIPRKIHREHTIFGGARHSGMWLWIDCKFRILAVDLKEWMCIGPCSRSWPWSAVEWETLSGRALHMISLCLLSALPFGGSHLQSSEGPLVY